MPGFELINKEEQNAVNDIFTNNGGVLFAHGFTNLRSRYIVREFEQEITKFLSTNHCLATTSGTVAQFVAMKAMGIGPGDEVITQAFTFVATVEAILLCGATPVIVDVDESYNMCPIELKKNISHRTKLIIPVHMLGFCADLEQILKIAADYKIPVMEDACEALGGKYKNKYLGTHGDVGIFSLDFAKTITTGEGGLIISNNEYLLQKAREYHDHGHQNNPNLPRGLDSREIPGMNFRMTEIQGAIGLAQLKKLDYIISKNREIYSLIEKNLDLKIYHKFRLSHDPEGELCDTFIIQFESVGIAKLITEKLAANNIYTKNLPDAIDWHFSGTWGHMFTNSDLYKKNWATKWSKTEDLLRKSISLPIFLKETYDETLARVEKLNKICGSL